MKNICNVIFLVLLLNSCKNEQNSPNKIGEIFTTRYEHSQISKGDNFPDFNPKQDSIDLLLVAIHEKVDIKEFQKAAGWTDDKLKEKIKFLRLKNWLSSDEILKPTVFITSVRQSDELYGYARPLSEKIANSIEQSIPDIKQKFLETDLSVKYDFESWSFLILSDVLLDSWQINKVEQEYLLQNDRPERHGKHYYYSIRENNLYPKESCGIYGNQFRSFNDSMSMDIYGNNRNFANERLLKDSLFLDSLMKEMPVLSQKDMSVMEQIANDYTSKLINILNENTAYIHSIYNKMGYNNEITFEEFFIWWYHLIYTDVTNILAEKKYVKIPSEGNFYFFIMK